MLTRHVALVSEQSKITMRELSAVAFFDDQLDGARHRGEAILASGHPLWNARRAVAR